MKSLLLLTGFFAILLVIYGALLFRARFRKLKRIAESRQGEILAASLIAEGNKAEVNTDKEKRGPGEKDTRDRHRESP